MNNKEIAQAWAKGQVFSRRSKALATDGSSLYSYNLVIGYTNAQGKKVAIDYTRSGGDYRSQTTSTHVGLAIGEATLIRNPCIDDDTVAIEIPKAVYDAKAFTKGGK